MPRFYFNLYNDLTSIDDEGVILPNVAVATQRAVSEARTIAAEAVRNGKLVLEHRIEITDERGDVVAKVFMRDAVEIEG